MRLRSWLLAGVVLVTLVGCGLSRQDIRNRFDPFVGQSFDVAVKALGPPHSCTALSTGDKLCGWDRSFASYGNGSGGTYTRRYNLVINQAGTVTEWQWYGPLGRLMRYVNLSSRDEETRR